jgi:Xaa-Pro aminopeptidase
MVADVFRELDLDHGRIGVELGIEQRMGLPFSDFSGLQAALPQVEWVDAADLLWQLRLIKSPAEIECMRRASASVMQAFTNVFPLLEPGVTQEQLMHKLNAAISEAGSEPGFIVISCDRETNLAPASLPSQRVADTRQLILVDAGASYHGYWCDFCRGVSLGRPDDRTLRAWEAMYRVTMRGVHTARPGVSVDQIVRACAQQAEEEGFQLNLSGGRMGHSIGLMITELPSMRLGEETVLQPGMTLTLEPSIVLDSTMFVVEQDFAITEEGADILSHGPWEIWVA